MRGALSIAFLERLEEVLAKSAGRPVRLCDWFDLIGGTSTGAILAAGLALGLSGVAAADFLPGDRTDGLQAIALAPAVMDCEV